MGFNLNDQITRAIEIEEQRRRRQLQQPKSDHHAALMNVRCIVLHGKSRVREHVAGE